MADVIDLPEWLERLGFADDEYVQIGEKLPGGAFRGGTGTAGAIYQAADGWKAPADRDTWVGPNPTEHVTTGRPGNDQVTRLAALHIDLDVKPGGCSSFDQARAIVDELAGMLGSRPVALTYSGHGLQPVWAIEEGAIFPTVDGITYPSMDILDRQAARALMRRWGRLVASVADRHGAHVDALWDLTRILRCPGSVNHKDPANPVPVLTFGDSGAPLTVERILETLDEWGVVELPDDARGLGDVVSEPSEWVFADRTCPYAAAMVRQWELDDPASRHGWLRQQTPRLAAAVRYGCFDRAGYELARAALTERFLRLISGDRKPTPGELGGTLSWGQGIAACMTDNHLASELGYHLHAEPIPAPPDRKADHERASAGPLPSVPGPDMGKEMDGTQSAPGTHAGVPATLALSFAERPAGPDEGARGSVPAATDDRPGVAQPTALEVAERKRFELQVEQGVRERLLRDEVKRRYLAETAPPADDLDAEYLDATELGDLPKPDPLIDGVLARHCYMVLRGRDGTFKSFVALDWALCIATGKPWQGSPAERAKVLYIAGEGAYGMDARIRAWCMAWQRTPERGWFTLRKSSVNLFTGGAPLDHLVAKVERDQVGLVVVDTLRRASGAADGNTSDMGVVVDAIDRIKQATTHGSVLVIAHTDKSDSDTRGYSGIEDDADIIWHAKRNEGENELDLTNTKMKDGPDGATFQLEPASVMESLVIQSRNGAEPASMVLDTDAQVMAAMRDVFASTGATARELLTVLEGMPERTMYRAVGRLEAAGRLHRERKGNSTLVTLTAREAATRRAEILRDTRDESDIDTHAQGGGRGGRTSDEPMIVCHPSDQEFATVCQGSATVCHSATDRAPHVVGAHGGNDLENWQSDADPFGTGLSA